MATKQDKLAGNNLYIVLLLVTLLALGSTALIGKALVSKIVRDTKVVTAKDKAEKQLTENLTTAPKLVDAYNAMTSEKSVLADALPTSSDLPSLLVTYENMAAQAGIKLTSVSTVAYGTPVVPVKTTSSTSGIVTPAPKTYTTSYNFTGSYVSLTKLFAAVELNARPMRITGVNLNGSGTALNGDITVETYFQDKAELPIGTEIIK